MKHILILLCLIPALLFPAFADAQMRAVDLGSVTQMGETVHYFPDGLASSDTAWIEWKDSDALEWVQLWHRWDSTTGYTAADCSCKIRILYNADIDTFAAYDPDTLYVFNANVPARLLGGVAGDTTVMSEVYLQPHKKRRYAIQCADSVKLSKIQEVRQQIGTPDSGRRR